MKSWSDKEVEVNPNKNYQVLAWIEDGKVYVSLKARNRISLEFHQSFAKFVEDNNYILKD